MTIENNLQENDVFTPEEQSPIDNNVNTGNELESGLNNEEANLGIEPASGLSGISANHGSAENQGGLNSITTEPVVPNTDNDLGLAASQTPAEQTTGTAPALGDEQASLAQPENTATTQTAATTEKTGLSSTTTESKPSEASAMTADADLGDALFGKQADEQSTATPKDTSENGAQTNQNSVAKTSDGNIDDDIFSAKPAATNPSTATDATQAQPVEAKAPPKLDKYGRPIPSKAVTDGMPTYLVRDRIRQWKPEYADMGMTIDDLFSDDATLKEKIKDGVNLMAENITDENVSAKFKDYCNTYVDKKNSTDRSDILVTRDKLVSIASFVGRENEFPEALDYVEKNIARDNASKAHKMDLMYAKFKFTRNERSLPLGYEKDAILDVKPSSRSSSSKKRDLTRHIRDSVMQPYSSKLPHADDENYAIKLEHYKKTREILFDTPSRLNRSEFINGDIDGLIEKSQVSEKCKNSFNQAKLASLQDNPAFDIKDPVDIKDVINAVNEQNNDSSLNYKEMKSAELFENIKKYEKRDRKLYLIDRDKKSDIVNTKVSALKALSLVDTAMEIGSSDDATLSNIRNQYFNEDEDLTAKTIVNDMLLNKSFHENTDNAETAETINKLYNEKLLNVFENSISQPLDKLDSCTTENADKAAESMIYSSNYRKGFEEELFDSLPEEALFDLADTVGILRAKKTERKNISTDHYSHIYYDEKSTYRATIDKESTETINNFYEKHKDSLKVSQEECTSTLKRMIGVGKDHIDPRLKSRIDQKMKILCVSQRLAKMGGSAKPYLHNPEDMPSLEDSADIAAAKEKIYTSFYK